MLIAAPSGRDAPVLAELLGAAGFSTRTCPTSAALCHELVAGAAVAVITRETLVDAADRLCRVLSGQPEWSDLPLIVLASAALPHHEADSLVDQVRDCANTVVLERPVSGRVLLSAVGAACRARLRQYQVRDELVRRHRAEHALARSEARYRTLYENAPLAYQSLDAHGRLQDVNPAWQAALGYRRDEVLGRWFGDLLDTESSERFSEMFKRLAEKGEHHGAEYRMIRRDGSHLDVALEERAGYGGDGALVETYAVLRDITLEKQYVTHLEHMARHDPLTGLPNRGLLMDRLAQAMARLERRAGLIAVVYADLDGFKAVNDRLGHAAGDQLLKEVTGRMAQVLRNADTLARVGGDELAALLLDLPDRESTFGLLDRLLGAASAPVRVDLAEIKISASLGVAFFPQARAVDMDDLLRQADHAMYGAKQAGGNRYRVYQDIPDAMSAGS